MSELGGIKFRPVMGPDAMIQNEDKRNGYFYVATDTGNMYLDVDNHRIEIGGSGGSGSSTAGFVWANGDETSITKVTDDDDDYTYYISMEALEEDIAPKAGNLILNSDGRFFRVIDVDLGESKITATLIAVSGAGGGSGGGGGSAAERDVNITWDTNTIATGSTYIYGQHYNAIFYPTTTAEGDVACNVTFTIIDRVNNTSTSITRSNQQSGKAVAFDMANLPHSSNITLQIVVTSDNSQYNDGRGYTRNITNLKAIAIDIQKPYSDSYLPLVKADDLSGTLSLNYMPIGEKDSSGNALLPLTLHVYVDNMELPALKQAVPASYYSKVISAAIPRQSHGVHKIEFALSTKIGEEDVYTQRIGYEGAWQEEGNENPIIWIGKYDEVVVNYENSYIYYMVFDPINYRNGLPAEIHLYKEGNEISQMSAPYSDNGWLMWDISNDYEVGNNNFSISCRNAKVDISIFVTTEGSRDLGLAQRAAENLILNITTAGRSSSEIISQRSILKSTVNTDTVDVALTNFNWQNNGWRDSEGVDAKGVDNGAYLSIANGSGMVINAGGIPLNNDKDYSFEMRFRVRNVQEYSTLIKVVPKYFYDYPDPEHEGEWLTSYTLVLENDEEKPIAKPGFNSLYEWEIKQNGYRIGVDKYGNLLMDEENTIKEEDTSSGVVVRWLNPNGYGFCIGTQEAFFKGPSGIANVRYCENEVINISIIVSKSDKLVYMYLNGVLSGTVALPTGSGSNFTVNTPFVFNSEYCDFDFYRFRICQIGLTMPEVIHNYLSDMHSIKLYDQNQLTDQLDPTSLSFDLLKEYNENNPDALTMPYATWKITDGTDELLPWKKGNNRAATIEFVNPSLDRALETGEIGEWEYYTHCPSFIAEGVDINVQGTSTQKYPRRNYKTKFKNAKNTWVYTKGSLSGQPLTADYVVKDKNGVDHTLVSKYHMDVEAYGVNKFTWKIDYMESSGSYNTGLANLMGNLVHPLYTKHPLDDLNIGIDTSDLRTTIYGFPVLTFHEYADGTHEYIGKYLMNIDKSGNEAYGFELKNKQPYVPTKVRKVLDEATNTYVDEVYQPSIKEIAECWEMKDNQGNWCSYKFPDDNARATGFMTLQEGTSGDNAKLEILNHYEYRYNFYEDELDAAYKYTKFTDRNTQIEYTNNGQINTFLYERHANFEKLFIWLDSTDTNNATNASLDTPVTYSVSSTVSDDNTIDYELVSAGLWNATFHNDTVEYRRQKFRSEFSEHLDLEYCLTYFVITELLLCYDSRGKNCMMATFGPHRPGGEYIWYPMFYDIDTQLGLNNSGAYLWDYDADVTKDNLFSTPTSVLWVNLYDLFYADIVSKYQVLRGIAEPTGANRIINGSLTEANIVGAYEFNPVVFNSYAMKGVRPIIAIGLDEYYKYLAPALSREDFNGGKKYAGYYDTSGSHLYQATPTYAYCAQGDKKLTTELLIRNRLNYIDSWWLGGDYRAGVVENQIFIRANANHSSTSDLFLDSNSISEIPSTGQGKGFSLQAYPVEHFDARPGAKIKPFLHQYVSYFMDSQPSVPVKYDGSSGQEDGVWTNVDSGKLNSFKIEPDLSQQITYIPGGDYISSIGDISLMYPNSLQIFHGQRLLDLNIGSDYYGYKNPLLTTSSDWELAEMPLLKSVNISNLSQFKMELGLTASEKLQEFRALGSAIERVNFAAGAPLHTVHLPQTMTTVSFVQNQDLNIMLTEKPQDPNTLNLLHTRGLYIEGVTDYIPEKADTGHKLTTYEVQGGGLGYNSYIILENLYNLKAHASSNQNLQASLTDVHWSPYNLVEQGTPYVASTQYYLLNDHSLFEEFQFTTADDWNNKLLNEVIYTYDGSVNKEAITNLDLLDNFIAAYNLAAAAHTASQFANTSGSASATVPTITGMLHVYNTPETAINEAQLTSKYAVYFPNLQITANYVNTANLTKYVRVYSSGKEEVLQIKRTDGTDAIIYDGSIPTQTYYDFQGWGYTPERASLVLQYDAYTQNYYTVGDSSGLTFNSERNTIVLYAVFTPHVYTMNFYLDEDATQLTTVQIPYGDSMYTPAELPYKDDSALETTQTYRFKGWSTARGSSTVLNMREVLVNKDMTFYPVFEGPISVYENPLSEDYLYIATIVGGYTCEDGSVISPAYMVGVNRIIRGKVTIPSFVTVDGAKVPVVAIMPGHTDPGQPNSNGFAWGYNGSHTITHLFFENHGDVHPQLKRIYENAFYGSQIQYIELPDTLERISQNAFAQAHMQNYQMINVPYIERGAFYNLYGSPSSTLGIGPQVKTIGANCFAYTVGINHIVIGTPDEASELISVADTAWARAGESSMLDQITVYRRAEDRDNPVWQSGAFVTGTLQGAKNIEFLNV